MKTQYSLASNALHRIPLNYPLLGRPFRGRVGSERDVTFQPDVVSASLPGHGATEEEGIAGQQRLVVRDTLAGGGQAEF